MPPQCRDLLGAAEERGGDLGDCITGPDEECATNPGSRSKAAWRRDRRKRQPKESRGHELSYQSVQGEQKATGTQTFTGVPTDVMEEIAGIKGKMEKRIADLELRTNQVEQSLTSMSSTGGAGHASFVYAPSDEMDGPDFEKVNLRQEVKRLRRQRNNARLREIIQRGKVRRYRRAMGQRSSTSEEEEDEDSQDSEDDADGYSFDNESYSETEEEDDEDEYEWDESVAQKPRPTDGHHTLRLLDWTDVHSLRWASKEHARLVAVANLRIV